MRERKAVVKTISTNLLIAASFCIYRAHTEKKMGHHNEIKSQNPCEKVYENYCLNGGECFYLVDEDNVGCICTWRYGGKCEKYMWWD